MESTPTSTEDEQDFRKKFSLRRVMIPVVIGLLAAGWLLWHDLSKVRYERAPDGRGEYTWVDANKNGIPDVSNAAEFTEVAPGTGIYRKMTAVEVLGSINWTWISSFWILMAIVATALRDLGYIYRMRVLSDGHLSWRQSFNVTFLWEFASALTPSVVGGSGIAMFIIGREGLLLGRATAIVLVTALMDELFYVIMVPLVFVFVGIDDLFPAQLDHAFWGLPIMVIFWVGYAFILAMVFTVTYSVFFRPRAFKFALLWIFKLPFLVRWRPAVIRVGDDIVTTSVELRGKPKSFWAKAFGATCISWGSRFLVINFICAAFFNVSDHLLLYARQLIMWVILLISPTPGSSGVAEVAFSGFFRDLLPAVGYIGALAVIWRILSYYLYLFIGTIVLPRWLRNTAGK
ncbi:MAG: flippase-like domain-containing protein [Flavobacteriales bacterium]|nr:flippase-like domain-containing protein [Flavobacteriales bacterium]HQV76605.1 lysylphosphatidylglycerol synthase transmembrane domain-containing protein [Flavobacteriales bacterium]HQW40978.1 lysylphosphatidylglycerol synthase transmembrane domain-containing protein [Flavobacteriales bacterium]